MVRKQPTSLQEIIDGIISENAKRISIINTPFKPITGKGSIGERIEIIIDDFPIRRQYLPIEMMKVPLVRQLSECGSIKAFLQKIGTLEEDDYESARLKIISQFVRIRNKHDFPFWAAMFVYIKNKGGGEDVLFRLTRPQRRFVERLEKQRKSNKAIRIVLLKARQWGGSTTSQLYMAWLQLIHRVGLNSLIIAHQGAGSDEIKDMFDRMIRNYPVEMLHKLGDVYNENESKLVGVGKSGNIHSVPQRNCKIKIGTAERPDSCRGGDYNLVHLSEVGLWKATEGKKPEDIVRSACSGILLRPYTMIVYESTANGTGNFFQREYDAAKNGQSQFESMFISWFDIELYSLPIDNIYTFAQRLYENRNNENVSSNREENGKYLWWLWEKGASLEAINWYIHERSKYKEHGEMASEYPSDDVEAFVHSGARVFDKYKVESMKSSCRPAKHIGDITGKSLKGSDSLKSLHFIQDYQGLLSIWNHPEIDPEEKVLDRYLVTVDIGGRSSNSDWSVILVLDRLYMIDGDKPVVVAQWYGHIDMDLLAWKSVQIAAYYDNALLVIESNTLETHDRERNVDGDQSTYILQQIKDIYPNLYARKQSQEEIIEKAPRVYGFHTNVKTKPLIISTLVECIREHLYVERDIRCLDEYLTYERRKNGSYGAIPGKHDDLLMTRAIGLYVCFCEMPLPRIINQSTFKIKGRRAISAASI
ncbi:MAG: terminase [Bacteroidaceae bacterium]|nr:terminase [Bacteroidaceae bacterium]MBQ3189593.1 terminase [Bacteroidaceae bacterium]